MNSSEKFGRVQVSMIKPVVLAIALALPGAAAFAESFDDVVKTRADQNIDEQYGRDSVYAFSRYSKPATPDQTGPSPVSKLFDKTKSFAFAAFDKTKVALDKTKTALTPEPTIPPDEPQRYGRAGGFIGVDQFMVPQPGVSALAAAPPNADAVKTGESQWGYAANARDRDMRRNDMPSARDSRPEQDSSAMSEEPAARDAVREQNAPATGTTLQQDSSSAMNAQAEPVIIPDHTPMETQDQTAVHTGVVDDTSAMSNGRTESERVDNLDQGETGDASR